MADLPLEGRTTVESREIPLTTEEKIDMLAKDVREVARGVNTQAALLETIVVAFDHIVKRYIELTRVPDAPKEETK